MIARVTGRLAQVGEGCALVDSGTGVWYEVLVPTFSIEHLNDHVGGDISLFTIHYIEGDPSHGAQTPRLIGFVSDADRAFFRIFTGVKGIGFRKALRALVVPVSELASAIAAKDARMLVKLPEIGKRTAEQIILELRDKIAPFVSSADLEQTQTQLPNAAQEAVSVLVQLGERRGDAVALVERVMSISPELECPEEILKHAYRLRSVGK